MLSRRNIRRNGNIVNVAEAEEVILHVAERGRGCRGAEIQKYIYLVVRNTGRDLLFAALGARKHSLDLESRGLAHIFSGRAGRADIMF